MELFNFSALAWLMTIASGLMAGTYLAFSMVIMKSLAQLTTSEGIVAMNAINRTIVKTGFMPLFFGSTIIALLMVVTGLWFWGAEGANRALIGGLTYFIGMFLVTALRNVPLNNELDKLTGTEPAADKVWNRYLSKWTQWNSIRALACLVTCMVCMDLSQVS